jgi:formylglycine-generating enzyme required for sulfatase activity
MMRLPHKLGWMTAIEKARRTFAHRDGAPKALRNRLSTKGAALEPPRKHKVPNTDQAFKAEATSVVTYLAALVVDRIGFFALRRGLAIAGLITAVSVSASACSSDDSSTTSSTTTSASTAASSSPSGRVARPGVVTIDTATVGDPGNPSVGVVQTFGVGKGVKAVQPPEGTGIYANCSDAPPSPKRCLTVGNVKYTYGIGEFETTVTQYVTFLNTVDPDGRNRRQLYFDDMSPTNWPRYGSVSYSSAAGRGEHYSVAYPEWAEKPFNFADFSRAARFVNSLTNGRVLSSKQSSSGGFKYVDYTVRLSPRTEQGMYDMKNAAATRSQSSGFVLPSNNEWVKAAYYDPKGGGTDSYWEYPTGPFDQPNVSVLNPGTGDVTNADTQPLSTYNPNDPNSSVDTPGAPPGGAPNWCPSQAGSTCSELPFDDPPGLDLEKNYMANVSTVGQTKTTSPWGTYDQWGNVVEILDTLAPQPPGYQFLRNWHYYHGGVANAPAYQLGISAFGYFPGDTTFSRAYPWLGFRVGVIGNLK